MRPDYLYLDCAASTPLLPGTMEIMQACFIRQYGNPSSGAHTFGTMARDAVEQARKQLASLISVGKDEIVFTSGATESINLAIKGVFKAYRKIKGCHFISAKTEHKAVLNTLSAIEKEGAEITLLDVLPNGQIDPATLQKAIRKDTVMVALMHGNNETGVLHPIDRVGEICRESGVIFFCDASQSLGKIPIHPRSSGIHLMAMSAHKFYGPKGVGALYISRRAPRIKPAPLIHGGGQEGGLRSGTLNVPAIVGFGQVAEAWKEEGEVRIRAMREAQQCLEQELLDHIPGIVINGKDAPRLPHITNISFGEMDFKVLLEALYKRMAFATGSACNSSSLEPSHVLTAMHIPGERAHRSIRLSYGFTHSTSDMKRAARYIREALHTLNLTSQPSLKYADLGGDDVNWT